VIPNREIKFATYFVITINPLMPELNPSAQRCLTRCFIGDFASSILHFVNTYMREKPTNATIIPSVY
jgi:hypothetical protein